MVLRKVLAANRLMSINKIISPSNDITAIAKRNKVTATPRSEKISKKEEIFFALALPCSIIAIPAWIVCHVREYGSP